MLIGPEAGREYWFTPRAEAERKKKDPGYIATRFRMKIPSDVDQAEIRDLSGLVNDKGQYRTQTSMAAVVTCRRCMTKPGWENYQTRDPETLEVMDAEFQGDPLATSEDVAKIPPSLRAEIYLDVQYKLKVSEDDLAPSDSPAT